LGGLLTRLAAKVAAYTCAQRINYSLDRPLRHLVHDQAAFSAMDRCS
jgi:hypothetical protein